MEERHCRSIDRGKLEDLLHGMPKIELHRHLIGSVRVKTLMEIAAENDIPLPASNLEGLRKLIEIEEPVQSLRQFLRPLSILGLCFYDRKAAARVAYEVAEDAARENVEYVELIVGPAFETSFHRLPLEDFFDGVIEGLRRAETRYGIRVNLIAGPTFRWRRRKAYPPIQVLECSLRYRDKVVGLGLTAETKEGVPFSRWSPGLKDEYVRLARQAKEEGLGLTCHAGEVGGAQSVLDAVEHLRADRIGHGIRLADDPGILEYVVKRRIPLEVCVCRATLKAASLKILGSTLYESFGTPGRL